MEISQAQQVSNARQELSLACEQALYDVSHVGVGADGRYWHSLELRHTHGFARSRREESNHLFILILQLQEIPKIWCFVSNC